MKILSPSTIALVATVLTAFVAAEARGLDATVDIENTINGYFRAMSQRDAKGISEVVDKSFVAVEAGGKSARTQVVNTTDPKRLLPPAGNDDWTNVKVSSLKANISATDPTLATASFDLIFPLSENQRGDFQKALNDNRVPLKESQRKAIAKVIANKAFHHTMFAMLARDNGKWKIVCLTLPK